MRIDDTSLWVVERGVGLSGDGAARRARAWTITSSPTTSTRWRDDLRLLFVDLRACGRSERPPAHTWTLERHAQDVIMLARALRLDRYAVLGHSYGAFVALQNAVDYPGMAAQTIVSSGVPSIRFLGPAVERSIQTFEPASLRAQVQASWEREPHVRTPEEFAQLMADQMPFHFADPQDPRIADYLERTKDTVYAPDVLRRSSTDGFGQIDLESRLSLVSSPTLVLSGAAGPDVHRGGGGGHGGGHRGRRAHGVRGQRPHGVRRGNRRLPRGRARLPPPGSLTALRSGAVRAERSGRHG